MKNFFGNSSKRRIAILFLGFFIFSFLHSELGFLDFDGHNHDTHDYCQIVKDTNAHSKILREDLPKLELNKNLCVNCFEEIDTQAAQTSFEKNNHRIKAKSPSDLYLFNRTFLI
jgi:hypothetical protein